MDDNKIYDVNNYEEVKENIDLEKTQNIELNEESENANDFSYKPKKKRKGGAFKVIAIALIAGLMGGAIGGAGIYYSMKDKIVEKVSSNVIANPQSFKTDGEAMTASDAFSKVAPAVVIVSANGVIDTSGIVPKEAEGLGSGFIINDEGYIITNYHVIEGAKNLVVTLSSGKEVKAKVVNYDQEQDIAMIKLNEDVKVPGVVELGDSNVLKQGEEVLAIGTPLSKEFSQTVTGGMVSAVNRTVQSETGKKLKVIQTDAAINPGNSGGPLVNTKGQVIGINTMKISDGAEGIGFSIPINEVKDRVDALSKPILNLGVSIREIDQNTAKQYKMDEGLYVVEVNEYSPAEKAGIKSGDIIVKFDGKSIKTLDDLKAIRDTKKEGDTVKVEVVRNGDKKSLDVTLTSKQ